MKTFTLAQVQQAQDWRPQIERFIFDQIYVVETLGDYEALPQAVKDARMLTQSAGF